MRDVRRPLCKRRLASSNNGGNTNSGSSNEESKVEAHVVRSRAAAPLSLDWQLRMRHIEGRISRTILLDFGSWASASWLQGGGCKTIQASKGT